MSIKINKSKCIGCGSCVLFCPTYALSVSIDNFRCKVDQNLCNECLVCIEYCPTESIEEKES
jgi:ferredoxin